MLNSLQSPKPADQRRALTSIGLALGERYGLKKNAGISAVSEMARTLAGELGKFNQLDYDAAARTMTNRLDALRAGININKPGTVRGVLGAYDANRYTKRSQVPATIGAYGNYKAAKPGTGTFQKGITAVANAMSPYGEIQKTPIADSTHYYSGPKTKAYQKDFSKYGPHKFGNPDVSAQRISEARKAALAGPPEAGLSTGNLPGVPANARGPAVTVDPRSRALPREKPAAFGQPRNPSSFPSRPERVGSLPAARTTSNFPGRPSYGGAFPAEDAQPSTFPGRQSYGGAFPAARAPNMDMGGYGYGPMASVGGMPGAIRSPGKIQDRIAPEQRPAQPAIARQGPGLLASPNVNLDRFRAPPSSFPARPGVPGAFPAEDAPPGMFPGRPEFPGALPGAAPQVASTFPGRPGYPGAFPAGQPQTQFADTPLGQTFGRIGRGVGFGMKGLAQALKAYEDNKGKIAIANAVGFNPIGRAVKAGLGGLIKAGQNQIASLGQPGPQMAESPSGLSPPLGGKPGAPGAPETPEQAQQRSVIAGMLRDIMSRGGPKNAAEQRFVMQLAEALQAMPLGGGMDFSVTENLA